MKFGKERKNLDVTVSKYLYDINANNDKKDRMMTYLIKKKYPQGTAESMISGIIPPEVLPEIDIYVLLIGMYNITRIKDLDPRYWITDDEIEITNDYKEMLDEEILTFPLVIDDVLEVVKDEQWIFTGSNYFINKLYSAKLIKYNFRTQRNPKLIKRREGFKKVPNTNPSAVTEIADKIRKKKYTPNTITFNLNKDKMHDFRYDRDKKRLVILEGDIDILDGWHRCLSLMALLLTNPELRINFEIRFVNYSESRAAEFVKQEDIRNKISEQHLASIDVSDLSNSVTKEINENIESDMRGKIATDKVYIREGIALTMFTTVSKTIDVLWELVARFDVNKLSNYLIKFFNKLIEINQEELFTNIKENKKLNYINHEGMFVFYLTLAKEIQKYEDWEEKLVKVIENTNFNKNNLFWDNTGIITTSEAVINRHRKHAIKEFQKYIKEVLNNVK